MIPNDVILLGIALLGLLCGYGLFRIAREEVIAGRKYLLWLQWAIFVIMMVAGDYVLGMTGQYLLLGIITIAGAVLLFLSTKVRHPAYLAAPYTLGITLFFLMPQPASKLILASLLFLYGLPTGTLIAHEIEKKST